MDVRRLAIRCLASASAAVLVSCGGTPAAPAAGTFLRLTGTIDQSVVTRNSPASLTFQLENVGGQSVTLTFPSSCQINPYIVERGSGRIVYPAGGAWVCATVVTTMDLVSRGVAVQSVLVRAADTTTPSGASLPAGEYAAYATVDANEVQLRSGTIAFVVQ